MRATDPGDDSTIMELTCNVMPHVADEETILLYDGERLLTNRIDELGMQMTKRRLQLMVRCR